MLFVDGRDGPANREPALRQGPLRLRLRPSRTSPDQAADPARRRAEERGDEDRSGESLDPFPRSHLGRGAGFRGGRPEGASARNGTAAGLAGFGSAKGSNEEAYLFQKLVRQGFGTNNVDHCTRLCHASSVAALMECIGSGAVTAPFTEMRGRRRAPS